MDTTAESRFVLALVRALLAGSPRVPVPESGPDWSRVANLLLEQRISTTVFPLLAASPGLEPLADRIRDQVRMFRRRNSLLTLELFRALETLESAGIDCLALKGPALGRTVYRRPEDRWMADLDVLVRHGSLKAASSALAEIGYTPLPTLRDVSFYEKYHFHLILGSRTGVPLELHWQLARPDDYCRFDVDGLFDRARRIRAGGIEIQVPSNEDQLLHAASQSLREGFDLRRLIDVALLLDDPDLDPSLVERLAAGQGMGTAVWLTLDLCRALWGTVIPAPLEAGLRPGEFTTRCLDTLPIPASIFRTEPVDPSELKKLTSWLCAPDGREAASEIRKYLIPGVAQFLGVGHRPNRLPGPAHRVYLSLVRFWSLFRILGHQALRLTRETPAARSSGP